MKIYILHENDDWLPPLCDALDAADLPYEEWFLDVGTLDLQSAPPEGVFLNRMSASSHTRGHDASIDYTRQVLAWLEQHGRRVVNGRRAFELEMSKVQQQVALEQAGIQTPETRLVAGGRDALLEAAEDFPTPFITKHNCGGKGLGVQLFRSYDAFAEHVQSGRLTPPPDHLTLLQQYVEAAEPHITRCEFVDGRLVYAITADTSDGFELCPADACRVDGTPVEDEATAASNGNADAEGERCAVDGDDSLFALRDDVPEALVERYRTFLDRAQIDIAGIEFIEDPDGEIWTYDVNGTTNYNATIEQQAETPAWHAVTRFLRRELEAVASMPAS